MRESSALNAMEIVVDERGAKKAKCSEEVLSDNSSTFYTYRGARQKIIGGAYLQRHDKPP